MIIPGSTSQSLAATLADELDESLAPVAYDRFPDGECKVNIGDVSPDRAVIVASTLTDAAHIELLQLQDAAREAGADEIVTVIPYMGYARQDEAFDAGDPVSARAVARAVSTTTDRVLTVTPHESSLCAFFSPTADAVEGAPVLADPLPELDDPVFLSPDASATDLAETVRDAYGRGETDYFEKVRHSGTDVEITANGVDVAGRDVVVVDDIIATGTTMSEAVAILDDHGVNRVFVTCVHPLLARNARTKLARAGVEAVYGTDTIERPVSDVSVAGRIAREL